MEQWQNCDAVERHPEKLHGAWVFRGTRVPLAALFENLRDGAQSSNFLHGFLVYNVRKSKRSLSTKRWRRRTRMPREHSL